MAFRYLHKALVSAAALAAFLPVPAFAQTMGDSITGVIESLSTWPAVFSGAAYIFGIYLGATGIYKFKDHVDESSGGRSVTPLSEGVKRFLAGGMLLSLPYIASAAQGSLMGGGSAGITFSSYSDCGACLGVDRMVYNFVENITAPMMSAVTAFGYLAAIVFLFSGIIRLTKSTQEGPRGPTGMGTLMTFIVAGALFSFGDMIGTFSQTLFDSTNSSVMSTIGSGITNDATTVQRLQAMIDVVMVFVAVVGVIAFMRGWFVLKAFADGHQQATLAQGMTFLIGGTIAINLGHFMTFVQETVGLDMALYGVSF